jgi:ABC-type multidrug transport system fused ATPase/permease subunit
VTVAGTQTNALDLADLRGLFSVVTQAAALFDETLRENITLGRQVDADHLDRVLRAAHVAAFLPQLPNGLDSPAGPRGSNLSGGQRQRVAIARALLRDTPVLLLDEATSALDTKSEAVVQDALETLSKGRTTLVIAHRLSTVRNADKIVVMDKGKVVDQGTHDELLEKGGLYADLYRLQFNSEG